MSFANFVLIFYRLLVERVEWLDKLLGELWMFVVIFIVLYLPITIIVGAWHRKTQMKVEADAHLLQYPLFVKICRTIIAAQNGKATQKEIDTVRDILKRVEDKGEYSTSHK